MKSLPLFQKRILYLLLDFRSSLKVHNILYYLYIIFIFIRARLDNILVFPFKKWNEGGDIRNWIEATIKTIGSLKVPL